MKINMGMKALLASVVAAGALASSPAFATSFVGNVSSTYNSNDNNGLGVGEDPIHSAFNFTLNTVGQSYTLNLFNLFTDETSVDSSDMIAKAISVAFNFTAPTGTPDPVTIGGTTKGNVITHYRAADEEFGSVTWNANGIGDFDFGNGGILQIALGGDSIFNDGRGGLDGLGDCDSSDALVNATFTLEHLSTSVPEPYEWALMLLGVGMVGATLRQGRRRAAVTA
jgi:hypothetical protein